MADDSKIDEGEEKQEKYENLDQAYIDQISQYFDIFDKGKNEKITTTELGTLLRTLKFNPTERELQSLAREYDKLQQNTISKKDVFKIVDSKVQDTDTIEELLEALKLFDNDKDGKLLIPELRWAMTSLGERMDEGMVDEMVKELDPQKTGMVEILEFAKVCFNIKDK